MSVGWGAWGKDVVVASCLLLALQVSHAQQRPAVSPADTRTILVENAQALEGRGRPDLAIQVWQQVLLSDPNNTVALAGLARDFRLTGSVDKSNQALDRLRKIDPSNPEIARIEALSGASTNRSSPISKSPPPSVRGANPASAAASLPQAHVQQQQRSRGISQTVASDEPGAGLLGPGGTGQTGMRQVQAHPRTAKVQPVEMSLNPPHSLASNAWRGLIFSLMADIHYHQALEQLNKIPPDIRRQLDADVGFVQCIASLYIELGDSARAAGLMGHLESFYLLHRAQVPAGLEIQYAWLLYNMQNDASLYPVMIHLDKRTDLTTAERNQMNEIWASWAVGRADVAMERGNIVHGVQLLQAASDDYPNNLMVRRAIAAADARVGRAADALVIYKTIPMTSASPGDYQGAISAAMSAGKMTQAEAWLRDALAHYPDDPRILGLAARFEQARGDNVRAAGFWRAALAAMPPGSPLENLESGLTLAPDAFPPPQPGDTKHLLNPQLYPLPPPSSTLPPLPAYPQLAPVGQTTPATATQPPSAPERASQYEPPSNNPLPLPPLTNPADASGEQDTQPVKATPERTPPSPPPPTYHLRQSTHRASPAARVPPGAR